MTESKFNEKLLADILIHAISTGFCDYDKYIPTYPRNMSKIASLTRQDITQLAKSLLSKETFDSYPGFKTKKLDLFSKLEDATNEAQTSLEAKRKILHQICLNIIEEFSELDSVTIESVEHSIIKIMCLQNQVENSTYIAINNEQQLKQNIQDFLKKIETSSK